MHLVVGVERVFRGNAGSAARVTPPSTAMHVGHGALGGLSGGMHDRLIEMEVVGVDAVLREEKIQDVIIVSGG